MHQDHDVFVTAIKEQRKVRLMFSDNDGHWQGMSVVPLDYNPGRRTSDKSSCYQFWDFKIGANGTPLALFTSQIKSMEMDAETFNSDDFIKVVLGGSKEQHREFYIKRDWGLNLPGTEK